MGDRTCPVSPTPCAQPYLPRPCLLPAVLASGERLPCDLFVVAAGCKYNLNPSFLKEMKLGRQGWLLNSWKGGAAHSRSAVAASGHAKAWRPPLFLPPSHKRTPSATIPNPISARICGPAQLCLSGKESPDWHGLRLCVCVRARRAHEAAGNVFPCRGLLQKGPGIGAGGGGAAVPRKAAGEGGGGRPWQHCEEQQAPGCAGVPTAWAPKTLHLTLTPTPLPPQPHDQECEQALEPTALPEHSGGKLKGGRMAGSHTWFESRSAWSCFNVPIEVGHLENGAWVCTLGAQLSWAAPCNIWKRLGGMPFPNPPFTQTSTTKLPPAATPNPRDRNAPGST